MSGPLVNAKEALNAVGVMMVLVADKYGFEFIPRTDHCPESWKHPDGTVISTEELIVYLERKRPHLKGR